MIKPVIIIPDQYSENITEIFDIPHIKFSSVTAIPDVPWFLYNSYELENAVTNTKPIVAQRVIEILRDNPHSRLIVNASLESLNFLSPRCAYTTALYTLHDAGVGADQIHQIVYHPTVVRWYRNLFPQHTYSVFNHWETHPAWHQKLSGYTPAQPGDYRFAFFNRRFHESRAYLAYLLMNTENFERNSIITFGDREYWSNTDRDWAAYRDELLRNIPDPTQQELRQWLDTLPYRSLPNIAIDGSITDTQFLQQERCAAISIVTESFPSQSEEEFFPTEKIFRPIMQGMPFIVCATPGYTRRIAAMGYRTYDQYWDTSWDNTEDLVSRIQGVAATVQSILELTEDQFQELQAQTSVDARYNQRHWRSRTTWDTIISQFDHSLSRYRLPEAVGLQRYFGQAVPVVG